MSDEQLFEKFFTKDADGHTIGSYGGWYILPDGRIVDCAEFFLWRLKNQEDKIMDKAKEIQAKINELEKPDTQRHKEIRQLNHELIEVYQERLRPLIGRCYKSKRRIFIIIDVPQPKYQMTGSYDFNRYQLPALIIELVEDSKSRSLRDLNIGEIYYDTIYTKASEYEDAVAAMNSEYSEIPLADFRIAAHEVLDKVIRKVTFNEF